MSVIFHLHLSW